MRATQIFLFFISLLAVFFLLVPPVFYFINNPDDNFCEMTYMYDGPKFINVPIRKRINLKSYSLIYYNEGNIAQQLPDKFSGHPVLFIPGNAGSKKQVRSFGSVAYQKFKKTRQKDPTRSPEEMTHFDFFAVDFSEELTALYGGLIFKQVDYTAFCIQKILSFYLEGSKDITLIGHSMGGLVARAIPLLSDFSSIPFDFKANISSIITLSTPHSPVLLNDLLLAKFYSTLNRGWSNPAVSLPFLVSIGGGRRDTFVYEGLTRLNHLHGRFFWTSTDVLPRACLSSDHLAIVWCKQVVVQVVRYLYESLDVGVDLSAKINFSPTSIEHTFMEESLNVTSLDYTDYFNERFNSFKQRTTFRKTIFLSLLPKSDVNDVSIFTTETISKIYAVNLTQSQKHVLEEVSKDSDAGSAFDVDSIVSSRVLHFQHEDISSNNFVLEIPYYPQKYVGLRQENANLLPEKVNSGRPLSVLSLDHGNEIIANGLVIILNEYTASDVKPSKIKKGFTQLVTSSDDIEVSRFGHSRTMLYYTQHDNFIINDGLFGFVLSSPYLSYRFTFHQENNQCPGAVFLFLSEQLKKSSKEKQIVFHVGGNTKRFRFYLSCGTGELVTEIDFIRTSVTLARLCFVGSISVIAVILLLLLILPTIANDFIKKKKLLLPGCFLLSVFYCLFTGFLDFLTVFWTAFFSFFFVVVMYNFCKSAQVFAIQRELETEPPSYLLVMALLIASLSMVVPSSFISVFGILVFFIGNVVTESTKRLQIHFQLIVLCLSLIVVYCEIGVIISFLKAVLIEGQTSFFTFPSFIFHRFSKQKTLNYYQNWIIAFAKAFETAFFLMALFASFDIYPNLPWIEHKRFIRMPHKKSQYIYGSLLFSILLIIFLSQVGNAFLPTIITLTLTGLYTPHLLYFVIPIVVMELVAFL